VGEAKPYFGRVRWVILFVGISSVAWGDAALPSDTWAKRCVGALTRARDEAAKREASIGKARIEVYEGVGQTPEVSFAYREGGSSIFAYIRYRKYCFEFECSRWVEWVETSFGERRSGKGTRGGALVYWDRPYGELVAALMRIRDGIDTCIEDERR
jgi:hypothetical protein